MIYRRSPQFKKAAAALPKPIQEKVKKAFTLFKDDPGHPSLGIKKIQGNQDIWEGRIDDFYRFTFEYQKTESGEVICWFRNIGRHDIIDHAP